MVRKTPIMGWASWNCFRTNISEEKLKAQIDALVSTGLAGDGYTYFNIDDGFFGGRAADGTLRFHPVRFPHGVGPVAAYAHEHGLRAGIYSDGGDKTCGFYYDGEGDCGTDVGLYGHEQQDLELYLDTLGFDFIKVDWCGGLRLGLSEQEQYTRIGRIIADIRARTGRPIVYNICRWQFPGAWAAEVADSWRTGADIEPNFASILHQIDRVKPLRRYCGPGHVNDLDMMQLGNGLSPTEEQTHFAMWCMLSTPLMIGCDLTAIRPETLAVLKNRELIALDQDSACLQAYVVKEQRAASGELAGEVWIKDLGGAASRTKAVAFLNRSDAALTLSASLDELGLGGAVLHARDLLAHKELAVEGGSLSFTLAAHEVAVVRIEAERAVPVQDVNEGAPVLLEQPAEYVSLEQARALQRQGAALVDVRERAEYAAWHLEGAINIPYTEVHGAATTRLADKDGGVIVYCRTGKRSAQARTSLACLGYNKVYILGGVEPPQEVR